MTPSKEQIEAWRTTAEESTELDAREEADYYRAFDRTLANLAYAAGRRAGMEEAANICEGEISGATEDASRDAALSHCIRQIRAAMETSNG